MDGNFDQGIFDDDFLRGDFDDLSLMNEADFFFPEKYSFLDGQAGQHKVVGVDAEFDHTAELGAGFGATFFAENGGVFALK